MSQPIVIRSIAQLREFRKSAMGTVGVVPTMGALHEGHAFLLRTLRSKCDVSVLTIFVNPTQFGPKEDLSRYPRTFEKDLETAAREGVDLVFAPTPEEIYPEGYSTYVEETSLSQPFCGTFRPGHFRGVTTVVLKLFHLIQPHLSLFGLKDAQQFFVLSKMVRDLNLEVEVIGVPTVREKDGLAMSSRNVYLTPAERELAPFLYQTLLSIEQALLRTDGGEAGTFSEVLTLEKDRLTGAGFRVQYLDCVELPQFKTPDATLLGDRPYLVAVAAYLGTTRLIDNVILRKDRLGEFASLLS